MTPTTLSRMSPPNASRSMSEVLRREERGDLARQHIQKTPSAGPWQELQPVAFVARKHRKRCGLGADAPEIQRYAERGVEAEIGEHRERLGAPEHPRVCETARLSAQPAPEAIGDGAQLRLDLASHLGGRKAFDRHAARDRRVRGAELDERVRPRKERRPAFGLDE